MTNEANGSTAGAAAARAERAGHRAAWRTGMATAVALLLLATTGCEDVRTAMEVGSGAMRAARELSANDGNSELAQQARRACANATTCARQQAEREANATENPDEQARQAVEAHFSMMDAMCAAASPAIVMAHIHGRTCPLELGRYLACIETATCEQLDDRENRPCAAQEQAVNAACNNFAERERP